MPKKPKPSVAKTSKPELMARASDISTLDNANDPERKKVLAGAKAVKSTAERVSLIHDLMLSGQWIHRVTERYLASQWAVTCSRVRQLSAEASRLVRRELGADEVEQRRNMALAQLDRIKAVALRPGTPKLKDAIQAIKLEGQICGFVVQRHEINDNRDPFDKWTDEELDEFGKTGKTPDRFATPDLQEEMH